MIKYLYLRCSLSDSDCVTAELKSMGYVVHLTIDYKHAMSWGYATQEETLKAFNNIINSYPDVKVN